MSCPDCTEPPEDHAECRQEQEIARLTEELKDAAHDLASLVDACDFGGWAAHQRAQEKAFLTYQVERDHELAKALDLLLEIQQAHDGCPICAELRCDGDCPVGHATGNVDPTLDSYVLARDHELALAHDLLRTLEWYPNDKCPTCANGKWEERHRPECWLARTIGVRP